MQQRETEVQTKQQKRNKMENKNELNIHNIPLACNFERYNNYLLPSEEICFLNG